jgi:integrase
MLYRRGEVWWTKFKHGGRVYRLSTGEAAFAAARIQERRLRAEVALQTGPGGRQPSGVILAALEELHLEVIEGQGYDKRRIDTLRNQWRHLHRHLGEHRDAMTLTLAEVEDYEGRRRKEKHRGESTRGQTIRRERQSLIRALRMAVRRGLLPSMPFDPGLLERISGDPKKKSQQGKYREQAEIERVLTKLSAKAITAGHERMIRLVLKTGLRAEELARAAGFPLYPAPRGSGAKRMLRVPDDGTKSSDPRDLPLDAEAWGIFKAWRHRFAVADLAHSLERASKKAGIQPGVTLRDLRKTYLSRAAADDLPAAQRLGGHRNVATTGLYVDTTRTRVVAAGLRAAAMGSHPGAQTKARRRKAT